jgi:hypothetical protein
MGYQQRFKDLSMTMQICLVHLILYLPTGCLTMLYLCTPIQCQLIVDHTGTPPHHKDKIERQVVAMLKSGTVVSSLSPFASLVLLVKKKDGSWWFCVDYRKLNANTIKNKFPMPIIDEFLDEIIGAKFFTKLDLNSVFHQIRMTEADERKTAFKTHHGHFQFRAMPFGLTNAPVTFHCLMNSIFAPYMRKFMLVFMDDILIFSPSLEEHIQHLSLVFQVLRDHHLLIKFKKCAFAQ